MPHTPTVSSCVTPAGVFKAAVWRNNPAKIGLKGKFNRNPTYGIWTGRYSLTRHQSTYEPSLPKLKHIYLSSPFKVLSVQFFFFLLLGQKEHQTCPPSRENITLTINRRQTNQRKDTRERTQKQTCSRNHSQIPMNEMKMDAEKIST